MGLISSAGRRAITSPTTKAKQSQWPAGAQSSITHGGEPGTRGLEDARLPHACASPGRRTPGEGNVVLFPGTHGRLAQVV